jgi:hypothetical protein
LGFGFGHVSILYYLPLYRQFDYLPRGKIVNKSKLTVICVFFYLFRSLSDV